MSRRGCCAYLLSLPLNHTNSLDVKSLIAAALRGQVTQEMAMQLHGLGAEATATFVLAVNTHLAKLTGIGQATGANTPSGAIAPYAKGSTGKRRPGKPGGRDGHQGHRRPPPKIDRREDVAPISVCPDCSGHVLPARKKRKRRSAIDQPHLHFAPHCVTIVGMKTPTPESARVRWAGGAGDRRLAAERVFCGLFL